MQILERFFETSDGVKIFYRYKPSKGGEKRAIVIFHRGHEHSGRVMFIADELGLDDFSYFAWDARGHGKSGGERADAPSVGRMVKDVDEFIAHISQEYDIDAQNIAIVAQSVGAVVASAWIHDYAPKIRCAILASPAFSVKLYVPFAKFGLNLLHKWRGNFFVNSYVKARYLTHDKERIASYKSDDLIVRAISVRILLGLYETAKRVVGDAKAIITPIQLLISGSDWVVNHAPQHKFYNLLGSHIKERHVLKGFYHDTLGEKDRHIALSHVRRFINERFSEPFGEVDCTRADIFGFSREEADWLATPLPTFCHKNLWFKFQRFAMKALSTWVKGLKIGEDTGYDSGSTLDYVYQNEPQGSNKVMKFIDKVYLNAVGWRGIRTRKENIKLALHYAIGELRSSAGSVELLDIASGHGRYILDALSDKFCPDKIYLRDYSPINVEAGRRLIMERNLQNIATFEEKNAFIKESYDGLNGSVNLAVISGLFELFADNSLINTALNGVANALKNGGYLIYTNQPYHPQLEMIARSLSSHRDGISWIMRRRSQAEMDQLVSLAGFRKIRQYIDDDGIFSVSIAIRD